MKKRNIPFSPPDITQDEINEIIDTLNSGWITTGPKTKTFEKDISDYLGVNRTVCLNSQTACAEMTLRLLGIGPGDEVIVPAYTYSASCSVVYHVGATPVIIDSQIDNYEMDYEALENAITNKTKVIIPVDIGGVPCDYKKIYEIIDRKKHLFQAKTKIQKAFNRIIIVADSAHSFGAKQNNDFIGNIADFTSFSFHAVKNLTTSEGGAVTWKPIKNISDDEIYYQYQLLSLHGQSKDALAKTKIGAWEYDIVGTWYKCNMTDILASLGIIQLRRYPELLNKRKEIINKYDHFFKKYNVHLLKHFDEKNKSSGHLYMLRFYNRTLEYRNLFIEKMAELGVSTNVHYKPLPMHSAYINQGFKIEDFPNAYNLFETEITLPLHTKLTNDDVSYIFEAFDFVYNNLEKITWNK